MTDKKLLKMAAKAAGLKIWRWLPSDIPQLECVTHQLGPVWNPLTDDGDALRLACKLGVDVFPWQNKSQDQKTIGIEAATRRAIVRAAAEIGKAINA